MRYDQNAADLLRECRELREQRDQLLEVVKSGDNGWFLTCSCNKCQRIVALVQRCEAKPGLGVEFTNLDPNSHLWAKEAE